MLTYYVILASLMLIGLFVVFGLRTDLEDLESEMSPDNGFLELLESSKDMAVR